jgi:hypothetical protein
MLAGLRESQDAGGAIPVVASRLHNYKIRMTIKMKKLLLGTAIGIALTTTLSASVNAHPITSSVHSDITDVQLWLGSTNLMTREAPGYFNDLAFSGTVTDQNLDGYIDSANLQLNGVIGFRVNGLDARVNLGLTNGGYVQGSGIMFAGGDMQIDVYTTEGWIPYGVIDVSTTNMNFLAGQPGHMASYYYGETDQTTAGIVRDTLPGLWDGVIGSASFNRAAGVWSVLGQSIGFYMQGTIEAYAVLDPQPGEPSQLHFGPSEVPVPGAVWLFGSALAGLAGAARMRGKSQQG